MRVCHVITRLIVGGAQENTISSVLGLLKQPGFEVQLVSGPGIGPEGSLENFFISHPGVLTIFPELVRPVRPWTDWIALRKLTALFHRARPGVVHTHSGKAGLLGRLAARRARVPIIVHTVHGPSFGSFQGPLANLAFRSAERFAARFTTHFVTVANAMAEQYLAAGIGRPEQYTRIFSGFDLQPFLDARNDPALRAELGLSPSDFVVGKVARLFQLKGHDDLFRAAPDLIRACPSMKFLLVGGGEWRECFETLAGEMGIRDHVIFTGLVPPAQVPRYVGMMDALVHLSRREGLARALPRALAAGKPVVACDCDGAREACLEGETGFLVPPGDLAALKDRVLLLARDPALRARLGENGRAFAREHFGVQKMVDKLAALYGRLAVQQGLAESGLNPEKASGPIAAIR